MSREGQLGANMQVDDETSVNWGPLLGEESAQGNVPDLKDLLSKGRSASYSPHAKRANKVT